ncbi:MAG TPA: SRPBCC family protein, partial [Myxococcales bacterium]|nr:SRPBCC family protein [Myxococcales bacterium]
VTYTVDIKAKIITYTLKHTAEKPSKVAWTMLKGEMMKGNDGTWMLKAGTQPGTTDATYTIDLKLSSLVPGFIERVLAEQSLPGLLANFKKRAEALGAPRA